MGKLHTISQPFSGAEKSYGNSGFGFQLGTIPVVSIFGDNPERVNTLPYTPHPTPHTLPYTLCLGLDNPVKSVTK
ncbi:MAG: hypothetical protein F6J93_17830 [Oscillatoria sp. SIO1A7]|nr:hypothetical protein [Oscillatoria sp. SIO1A7]